MITIILICLFSYQCSVTEVYDGDTITANVSLGLDVSKVERIRLLGIDTPELRDETYAAGIASRDSLRSWILDKPVQIVTNKDNRDKYGRLLATVYLDTININNKMLRLRLAKSYNP